MSLAERAVVDMSENAKYSQTKLLAVMNVPSSTSYSHKAPKSPTEHDLQDALIIKKSLTRTSSIIPTKLSVWCRNWPINMTYIPVNTVFIA